jgi:hypothetical protein
LAAFSTAAVAARSRIRLAPSTPLPPLNDSASSSVAEPSCPAAEPKTLRTVAPGE